MKRIVLVILLSLLIGQTAIAQQSDARLTAVSDGTLQWLLRPIARPDIATQGIEKSDFYQLLFHQSDRDKLGIWRQVGKLKSNIQLNSLAVQKGANSKGVKDSEGGNSKTSGGGASGGRFYAVLGKSQVFRFDRYSRPMNASSSAQQMDLMRMRVQLKLPQTGRIDSAAADRDGYWLLLEPKLSVEKLSKQKQTPQDSRVLMQLTEDQWVEHPLPDEVLDLKQLQLVNLGHQQTVGFIGLLDGQLVTVSQKTAGQWSSQTLPLKVKSNQQVHWLNLQGHRVIAVSEQDDSQWLIQVKLLVEDRVLELGKFELPHESIIQWALLEFGEKVGLVTLDTQNQLSLQTLDLQGQQLAKPVGIKVHDPTDVMNQPGRLLVSVALMAAVFIMFSIWRRDPANAKVTLPKGYKIASISRRFLATVIDLAPCALISSVFTGVGLQQMVDQWPGVAITWQQLIPGLLTIGLFVTHTTVTEIFTAKTLGKKIMGLSVCTMSGKSPDLWQMILRNLLKILDLIAWYVLPVLVIVSAYRQRLGDVVARTLVVQPEDDET